ncbi:Heterokaryon incompatibility protein 6 [Diaporthe eres]|nr:Heterokaryon incompatibility protein 6 [Diaporthe eres]
MAALKTLRRTKEAVKFWIDAICINQADLEEKKMQIPLMDRIYQQAESVWGQVLPSFDKAESLRELIVAIGTAGRALEKDLRARGTSEGQASTEASGQVEHTTSGGSTPLIFTKYALEDYELPSETSPLWHSWREFFASPYFRRIWIQQEFVLAKELNLFLGDSLVDHQVLFTCMELMRRYSREYRAAYLHPEGVSMSSQVFVVSAESAPSIETPMVLDVDAAYGIASGYLAADRMLNERKAAEGSKQDRPLIDLLADYRDFCATYPRDMVFGLLGLAKDAERFYDLVDYSTPPRTFFLGLTQRLIDLGHGTQLLLQASNTEHREDLPSWVPNWSPLVGAPSVTAHQYSPIRTKDFSAGGEGVADVIKVTQDANNPQRSMLQVRGAIIDTIQHCSLAAQKDEIMPWVRKTHAFPPPFEIRDGTLSITFLFALQGFGFALEHVPKEQGTRSQSFLETCCQATRNFWEDQSHHYLRLGFLQFVSMYMQNNSLVEEMRGDFKPQDEMLPMKDFVNDVLVPLGRQRRFCTTKHLYDDVEQSLFSAHSMGTSSFCLDI